MQNLLNLYIFIDIVSKRIHIKTIMNDVIVNLGIKGFEI